MASELYSVSASCIGHGINHEGQAFNGTIEINPVASGKGSQVVFKAVGENGVVFHEETSLLGPGFDGNPCLFVLSNNHPAVIPHVLKREDKTENSRTYIFGFGDRSDQNSFREEIRLELFSDGSIEYKYFWGLPGGEFSERSGAKMRPQ